MATYRQIHIKIWSSPDFQELSYQSKFVFIYLFSNSHRNEAALYRITPKTISNETDLPIDQVQSALSELAANELIKWDQESNMLWVVNAIKYQKLSPNEVKGIKNNLATIDHEFVNELLTYYEDVFSTYEVPSKDIASNSTVPPGKGKGKDKDKDKGKDKYPPDSSEVRLSEYLIQRIHENDPGCRQPNIQTWAKHMDYILRLDKRPVDEVKSVIDYAQSDRFWISNILSTEKLREKYDTLKMQMRSKERASPTKTAVDKSAVIDNIFDQMEAVGHG